jgi:hypothetical protein
LSDIDLDTTISIAVAICAVGYTIAFVLHLVRRSRPALAIGIPVALGLILKIAATLAVSLSPFASIRGPDEEGTLERARILAEGSLLTGDGLEGLTSELYVWMPAVEVRLLEFPDEALRIVQVGLASVGLVLLAVVVHDLAGPRAAAVASWVLAFEPSTMFFSGLVLKEPLMLLAVGFVCFGAVRYWRDADVAGLPLLVAGFAIAVATRPYAGWFLVASAAALVIHSALRKNKPRPHAPVLLGVAISAVVLLAVPTLARISSSDSLSRLQRSQEANTTLSSANLALEPVDYSTRTSVVGSLPRRIRDVLIRPYPWQLQNTSQRLGLLGTMIAVSILLYLLALAIQNAGRVMDRAAPLVYPCAFLLAAYALSSGNAGTSFRYRTQLIALGVCIVMVLRASSTREGGITGFREQLRQHAPAAR